nr:hypothetical protein [Chloroflexota bacterium]
RVGTVAGRVGVRRFLVAGPLLMAASLVWFARLPVDSTPWKAALEDPVTLIPPVSVLVDILPYALLFGLGISLVVAPLTSTLMGSVAGRYSGLASAINNSISRVGQPLLGAVIFIVVSASYYGSLGSAAGIDTGDPDVRKAFQPLNPPPAEASAAQAAAANLASIEAFHLAMYLCAGLLVAGAAVAWYGLREPSASGGTVAAVATTDTGVRTPDARPASSAATMSATTTCTVTTPGSNVDPTTPAA